MPEVGEVDFQLRVLELCVLPSLQVQEAGCFTTEPVKTGRNGRNVLRVRQGTEEQQRSNMPTVPLRSGLVRLRSGTITPETSAAATELLARITLRRMAISCQ